MARPAIYVVNLLSYQNKAFMPVAQGPKTLATKVSHVIVHTPMFEVLYYDNPPLPSLRLGDMAAQTPHRRKYL